MPNEAMAQGQPVLRLAVRGFGHLGQALARILAERGTDLEARYGLCLMFVAASDSRGTVWSEEGLEPGALLATKSAGGLTAAALPSGWRRSAALGEVLPSCGAQVLVDLSPTDIRTGGTALEETRQALGLGLHLVSANKGPLVAAWSEIHHLAREHGVLLKYSGATAAALPTATLAHYELAGSRVTRLEGVLNGTSNYILTAMGEGRPYAEALAEAQSRGIAERDPSLDVEGYDTAVKLLLLCNSILGSSLRLADIPRQGITQVDAADVRAARQRGGGLKLVASAWREDDGQAWAEVALKELSPDHLLARVNGTEKGIVYHTDLMGRLAVVGGGSGPTPAAASVLRDLINLARELGVAH